MLKRLSITAALVVALFASWPRAAYQQAVDFAELEKVVLQELKEKNTPGAAVAIVSGDRILFARGFGTSNIETGAAVTPDMLFRLGSTTKMFTAAALVALAEEGKIKLDEPIGKYVKGLNAKVSQITAHQLLTHTAGIKDDAPMYGAHEETALGNGVRAWKEDQLFTEPGRILSYSNPGYWLAGFLVEELSGKPFADQMSESLFKPLGMASTTFRPTMAMTYPLAQGHNATGDAKPAVVRPMANNAASWPAGSIFSSVNDLSRFVIAFLNGGRIDGKQALSPAVIAKLSTAYAAVPGADGKYGYGLMASNHRGVRMIGHGGARSGYGSLIQMAPEQRFGVIVLANRSGAMLDKTADKAMELMLSLGPAPQDVPAKEVPMSAAEMANYVGTYAHPPTVYEIFIKDGKLYGRQGAAEGAIKKVGDYRFSIEMAGGPREFTLVPGADGRAEYLHMSLRAAKRQ